MPSTSDSRVCACAPFSGTPFCSCASQAGLKREALESLLEEELRAKETLEADNAMTAAMMLQHDSQVRGSGSESTAVGASAREREQAKCSEAGV